MPYQYNRNAFSALHSLAGVSPLLKAYSRLVCIELFLKEKLPVGTVNHQNGHDVPTLLHQLAATLSAPHQASLQALSVTLGNQIGSLWSEGFAGSKLIPSRSYPYIRYLRHDSEWSAPHSSDAELLSLSSVAEQVKFHLIQATGVQF